MGEKYETDFGYSVFLTTPERKNRSQHVVCGEVLTNNCFTASNLHGQLTTEQESLASEPFFSYNNTKV
jgi:hypothetical protein